MRSCDEGPALGSSSRDRGQWPGRSQRLTATHVRRFPDRMIDVVGEQERLIVLEGPSRSYRWLTSAWPAAALLSMLALQRWGASAPLEASLGALGSARVALPLLVVLGFVVLALLLRGWRTITYRF